MNQERNNEQDILQELGNIGIGSAATSFSALLKRPIQTSTSPLYWTSEFHQRERAESNEQRIGILFPFEQEIEGFALFLFDRKRSTSQILLNQWLALLCKENQKEEEDELLREICGILVSSYLSSVAEYTNLHSCIKLPAVSIDMEGAIITEAFSFLLQKSQGSIYLEHELLVEEDCHIQMIVMFHKESVNRMLEQLGVNP